VEACTEGSVSRDSGPKLRARSFSQCWLPCVVAAGVRKASKRRVLLQRNNVTVKCLSTATATPLRQGGELSTHLHDGEPNVDVRSMETQNKGKTCATKTRVIIVGAGPGGLALACAIAKQPNFEVKVLETRSIKQTSSKSGRSHSIGLGRRAREAIIAVGGQELWESISGRGMVASGFNLHFNDVALSLPAPEGEPVVLVDRGEITSALREHLAMASEQNADTTMTVMHSVHVKSVDLVGRTVRIEHRDEQGQASHEELLEYDLLLGSDGVRSRVREAMNSQLPRGSFESELKLMPGRWQVLRMDLPAEFEQGAVHAMVSSDAPFGLFCIPSLDDDYCIIVSWSNEEPPYELMAAKTPEDLEAVLLRYFPKLKSVPRAAAQSFLESMPSKAVVSRCRPLHNADAAVSVLGDAAHAVGGGSLGQVQRQEGHTCGAPWSLHTHMIFHASSWLHVTRR